MRRLLLTPIVALLFTSCAVGRRVPFNEADFIPYRGPGTGTVSGQLVVAMTDGERIVGKGRDVELVPVTPYTQEMVDVALGRGLFLSPSADSRFKKYARIVTANADGNFVFRQIPAGHYFLLGEVDRYSAEFDNYEIHWGLERITIGPGQTVHVTVSHDPDQGTGNVIGVGTLR
jgi:hypothetical protein